MYRCRVMYANGMGVEKDYQEAIKWYQMAAETGNSAALHAIGYMYVNGYGVPKDKIRTLMYWEISSAQGNNSPPATANKKSLLQEMSPSNIAEAQKMAKAWLKDHGLPSDKVGSVADSDRINALTFDKDGKITAERESGKSEKFGYYDKETGKLKMTNPLTGEIEDLESIQLDLLKKGAEAGSSELQYELAEKYISGDGVEKNRRLAEKWLTHSILNNNTNQKSIELIENEFNWHCVLTDDGKCRYLINKTSIKHDKYLSWYWSLTPAKIEKDKVTYVAIFKSYNVMNCNNRTEGLKTMQVLDLDLRVVPNKNFTYKDDQIKFKPLEPGIYSDRHFKYVCEATP